MLRPQFYVTAKCNLSCPYCSVRGCLPEGDMPADVFKNLVRRCASLGAQYVEITGGEPFVRDDLLSILGSINGVLPAQVLTNGTLITRDQARTLAQLDVAIQVSLDGASKEVNRPLRGEGSFEAALGGIRLLQDSGVREISIAVTIQRTNADDVENIIALAERERVDLVTFRPVVPPSDPTSFASPLDANGILKLSRRVYSYRGPVKATLVLYGFGRDALSGERWCVPGRSPCIVPDGSVFPCQGFAECFDVDKEIPRVSLEDQISSEAIIGLRQSCSGRAERIEECSICPWKHFCQGGCPALAYREHRTFTAKDSFCEARKRLYEDLFLYEDEHGTGNLE
ncbi:MAG: radical SAM protein [bacterium]|nr:radical SAM protein [bacterium]